MGISRKGCNTSKSLSPVIMQEAFAAIANSRNLLSFESRQTFIDSDISLNTISSFNSFKINNFLSAEIYLSNSLS